MIYSSASLLHTFLLSKIILILPVYDFLFKLYLLLCDPDATRYSGVTCKIRDCAACVEF